LHDDPFNRTHTIALRAEMQTKSLKLPTSAVPDAAMSSATKALANPDKHLRIAMMIESDGPGGAEMMVFRLAEELRLRGHSVLPVGPRNGTGWMGEMFRSAGFDQHTYWLKRPVDPGCVSRLAGFFRQHSIDIVHSHEFTMGVYGSTAASLLGVPHLLTIHGGLNTTKALRRRVALRWAIRRSGSAVAVSSATRDEFSRNLGLRKSAFTVVHNGVPSKKGDPAGVAREFGVAKDETVILAVGNLERNKNHRMLLEALVRLKTVGPVPPWKLIIAAGRGGPEHQFLLDYIEANRLASRVHIALGRSDIPDLQALADVFVMPSLWEGLPMALLEAMVAGNAIIASATAGIPEAIADGRDGLLIRPGDLTALTEALRIMLVDHARRDQLGAAAAQRAEREFTVEVMTERYLGIYRALVEDRRPAAAS
jgi:glycosyltransferase involved in cell wall biosynthesis